MRMYMTTTQTDKENHVNPNFELKSPSYLKIIVQRDGNTTLEYSAYCTIVRSASHHSQQRKADF